MDLQKQVVSLELAKKLKELGVNQYKSYFKWEIRDNGYTEIFHSKATSCAHKYYAAFTVAELGELLPCEIRIPNTYAKCELKMAKYDYGFFISYEMPKRDDGYRLFFDMKDKNEADARAKMLIYLIENGLIKNG